MTPKYDPKKKEILGEMPLGAPLVVQTALIIKKATPSTPKELPMIEKWTKKDTKEPPIVKKSSKSQAFSEPARADCAKSLQ